MVFEIYFSARRLVDISSPLIFVPTSEAFISAVEADVVMESCVKCGVLSCR